MLRNSKTVCLVTGASQRLGAAFSKAFAENLPEGSLLIMHSRSMGRLQNARDDILREVGKGVRIELVQWDLSHPDSSVFECDLKNILSKVDVRDFSTALIVHNAAQLGDLKRKVAEMKNIKELQDQLNVNVVSLLSLNAVWLELFKDVPKKIVVNLSAASASNPMPSFGLTSMCKSSRQMTLRVLAKESPDVQVVSFSPGAVDTESLREIKDHSYSKEMRDAIAGMYEKGQVLEAHTVADALFKLLDEELYESGAFVDVEEILKK